MYLRRSGTFFRKSSGHAACRRTAFSAVCILLWLLSLFLSSCSSFLTPKTDWQTVDFTCHALFSPYEADLSRTGGVFTMVLTAPDNLTGLTVTCNADGKYTLSCGDMHIPLSDRLAAGLGDFPGVLSGITGRVELDDKGYPCVLHMDAGTNEKTVVLTDFTPSAPDTADGTGEM
ncbi:MAG: hypothetical protein E7658_07300 [Ruminococcaceae bacterium]|nr:hypothetical protein [Oscillospiraceae bacterium]